MSATSCRPEHRTVSVGPSSEAPANLDAAPPAVATPRWLPAQRRRAGPRDRAVKRAVDVTGALVGVVVGAPLLLVASVAIRVEDGGPALFRQERVGEGGRPFTILKFRTMVVGAERQGTGLITYRADPRITRVGGVLRRTSIDELPQLFNVLRGDMSLVGPRPTVRSQVDRYTPFQRRRLSVRPGLAGWAQLNGRNGVPWSRRIELDVWYIENQSVRLDLWIILGTARGLHRGADTYGTDGMNVDLDDDGADA